MYVTLLFALFLVVFPPQQLEIPTIFGFPANLPQKWSTLVNFPVAHFPRDESGWYFSPLQLSFPKNLDFCFIYNHAIRPQYKKNVLFLSLDLNHRRGGDSRRPFCAPLLCWRLVIRPPSAPGCSDFVFDLMAISTFFNGAQSLANALLSVCHLFFIPVHQSLNRSAFSYFFICSISFPTYKLDPWSLIPDPSDAGNLIIRIPTPTSTAEHSSPPHPAHFFDSQAVLTWPLFWAFLRSPVFLWSFVACDLWFSSSFVIPVFLWQLSADPSVRRWPYLIHRSGHVEAGFFFRSDPRGGGGCRRAKLFLGFFWGWKKFGPYFLWSPRNLPPPGS